MGETTVRLKNALHRVGWREQMALPRVSPRVSVEGGTGSGLMERGGTVSLPPSLMSYGSAKCPSRMAGDQGQVGEVSVSPFGAGVSRLEGTAFLLEAAPWKPQLFFLLSVVLGLNPGLCIS